MVALKVERLSLEQLQTEPGWWKIYNSCFPPEEREPEEIIYRSLESGGIVYKLTVNNTLAGIASVQILESIYSAFLVYFAVDSNFRGNGTGSTMFQAIFSDCMNFLRERNLTPLGMYWEVENPELENGEGVDLRRKRIGFFQGNDGSVVCKNYFQPPVDGSSIVPMYLMFRSENAENLPEIGHVIKAIYFEKYGRINGISNEILCSLISEK